MSYLKEIASKYDSLNADRLMIIALGGKMTKFGSTAVDENFFFRQAALQFSSSLDIDTAMHRLLTYLKKFMPVDGMLFTLYDPNLNMTRVLASIWPYNLPKPASMLVRPRWFKDIMKRRLPAKNKVYVINDFDQEEPLIRDLLNTLWPADTSLMAMHLQLEERRLGYFTLFTEGRRRYRAEHAQLLALLHEPVAVAVSNMIQHEEISRLRDMLADENRYLHQEMMKMTGDTIVGANFGLRDVMRMVRQVAPIDSPVLLMGETGVGKEVIANAIQLASQRHERPYIKVNCGAIPENLIDSELFGHEKGAFTGAISRKKGHFERAHTGTIFLDEIGELPLPAQIRLLRVLQQQQIERVGGVEQIAVDVRVISATHRNLEERVRAGLFREDLWFRINVFPIIIPPLRRRIDDIPALIHHFIERKAQKLKIRDLPSLAADALDRLRAYSWPGNVRELENLVERALIMSPYNDGDNLLRFDDLPDRGGRSGAPGAAPAAAGVLSLDDVMVRHIRQTLDLCGGRVEGHGGAARLLKVHPSTLRARMRKLGVAYGRKS